MKGGRVEKDYHRLRISYHSISGRKVHFAAKKADFEENK